MFSLDVIDTDKFNDMPATARLLYYELGMRADDDGFLSSAKKVTRMVGCSEDDLKMLIAKGFAICFNNGIIVITHWHLNNQIRADRHKPTVYTAEKAQLMIRENEEYTLCLPSDNQSATTCQPNDNQTEAQVRLVENSTEKYSQVERRIGEEKKGGQGEERENLKKSPNDIFISLPTTEGNFDITNDMFSEYQCQYPSNDVNTILHKLKVYCQTNNVSKSDIKDVIAQRLWEGG